MKISILLFRPKTTPFHPIGKFYMSDQEWKKFGALEFVTMSGQLTTGFKLSFHATAVPDSRKLSPHNGRKARQFEIPQEFLGFDTDFASVSPLHLSIREHTKTSVTFGKIEKDDFSWRPTQAPARIIKKSIPEITRIPASNLENLRRALAELNSQLTLLPGATVEIRDGTVRVLVEL